MPYLKFDTPTGTSSNKGSCGDLVNYLLKEDKDLKETKEYFFNQKNDMISSFNVIESIDSNRQGLKKTESKFYSGSINFSEEELRFIDNDFKKIKQYTIEVFKQYANNFNKDLSIDDINWYAKIESNRYYKGNDEEVLNGKAKQGDVKPGLNTHAHFIVGRKSVDRKMKLSPVTNHINTLKGAVKGGFNRDQFKKDCETIFDNICNYNRNYNEKYTYLNTQSKGNKDILILNVKVESERIKYDKQKADGKIIKLDKLINHINETLEKRGADKLNKDMILNEAKENQYNGSIYKSLINLNFKVHEKTDLPKDINRFVLDYTSFLNQPFNKLPVSIKKDKIERYVFMINRRIPAGLKKIDLDQILRFEKSKNYSGKSFRYLNEINSLLKKNDTDELKLMLEKQVENLEKGKTYKKQQEETHEIKSDKAKSIEIVEKIIVAPIINEIVNDNYMIEKDSQLIDETEHEKEKIKKKKKKRRRNNPSRNM